MEYISNGQQFVALRSGETSSRAFFLLMLATNTHQPFSRSKKKRKKILAFAVYDLPSCAKNKG
jgi:hypothetical protein